MSSVVEDFVKSPSVELLNTCTRDQLLLIAGRFEITVKETLKDAVKANVLGSLVTKGILKEEEMQENIHGGNVEEEDDEDVVVNSGLGFQETKELLVIKQQHLLEIAKLKQQTEMAKLDMEYKKLELIQKGLLSSDALVSLNSERGGGPKSSDISTNLRLLPRFNEKDPDTFFLLFERIANARHWPEVDCTLMLQSVLTGKAQEAFAALSSVDCMSYTKVKAAVLKIYELVPEAYRQRFRNWRKQDKQSHVEFVRDLTTQFSRWCSSSEVQDFEQLFNLVVLEQFKNTVPVNVATYINESKVKTPAEAAVLADEYVLLHRHNYSGNYSGNDKRFSRVKGGSEFHGNKVDNKGDNKVDNKATPGAHDKSEVCHYCKAEGHWKKECPVLKSKGKFTSSHVKPAALANSLSPVTLSLGQQSALSKPKTSEAYLPFISNGFVSVMGSDKKVPVKVLRDCGSIDSFVRESVLPFTTETDTGESILIQGMGMFVFSVPVHKLSLISDLVSGEVHMGVRPELPIAGVDVILGNDLCGERVWADQVPNVVTRKWPGPIRPDLESDEAVVYPACAVTRAMAASDFNVTDRDVGSSGLSDLTLPEQFQSMSHADLAAEQKNDPSLQELFGKVMSFDKVNSSAYGYFLQEGLLFRKWVPHVEALGGDPFFQFVVPKKFRTLVLQTCHNNIAGHQGVRKTYNRVLRSCFWPRLKRDISAYIKECHTCQLTSKPNQSIKPAPLSPIPAVEKPFEHLIIDCVGPLPASKQGSKFLLTVMCQVTRYPAAYPLRTITTRSVVKALTQFISVFGIPRIIQSDQGSNFTSHMFAEVLKQLRVKHNKASAYHAQSQGALERFHQTLKSMLRSYCTELGKDWEEGLPWLLLASRGVVQESTGFSPNDLVFGHRVRGPMAILEDSWRVAEPPKSLLDYVNGFRHRLTLAVECAKENLGQSQSKMKSLYDRRTEPREFKAGDQVMLLEPIVSSPFQAKFRGPYTVVRQETGLNYTISTPDNRKKTKLCHVNLLKPYYSGTTANASLCTTRVEGSTSMVAIPDVGEIPDALLQGRLNNSDSLRKLDSNLAYLDDDKRAELVALVNGYPALFQDVPSRTHLIEHDVEVDGKIRPIRQRFYRVSPEKRKTLNKEVNYMLDNHIAEPCNSSWASPCLLVSKPDKTYRLCTDYRKVNDITRPDAFPLPRMEDCIDEVGSATYVSTFDLLKGYWQVPLSKRAQEICAFVTPSGLYKYNVMPFGLRNAPATFQRLMNRVVAGLEGCAVYLDDVVIFSDTWSEHIERAKALFDKLVWAQLTVNLAKCEFARATVKYLGRVVGQGKVRMVQDKVQAIIDYPPPTTKGELRRFLGLVGYYRSFCKNFSSVAEPLTRLLKKDVLFIWSTKCQVAFSNLKSLLCSAPVLAAPRLGESFSLQVDASNVGAGAALLQSDKQGVDRVVAFYSRKFNRYQLNYSVIEKEALALILALQHFDVYLGSGLTPLVVYTDHNPLTFLKSLQNPNQRLMRWALFLQPFNVEIRHIKGSANVMADALSRAY